MQGNLPAPGQDKQFTQQTQSYGKEYPFEQAHFPTPKEAGADSAQQPQAQEDENRRRGGGWALYGLLGIKKGDREGSARQGARNFKFFDAPVGLFVTVDSYLARGNWADAGMYIQTLMLAARGLGLHTCPQAAWIPFQEAVFRHLDIPEDQELVTGMSLGYADDTAIENTLVSEREDIANVAHFRGFD